VARPLIGRQTGLAGLDQTVARITKGADFKPRISTIRRLAGALRRA
jgi:hypothetical protein